MNQPNVPFASGQLTRRDNPGIIEGGDPYLFEFTS